MLKLPEKLEQHATRARQQGWEAAHSGNDGRIELETLSAAELEDMVARHEHGVGPMIIARLRQPLQMGAKIREAHARRTAAN